MVKKITQEELKNTLGQNNPPSPNLLGLLFMGGIIVFFVLLTLWMIVGIKVAWGIIF